MRLLAAAALAFSAAIFAANYILKQSYLLIIGAVLILCGAALIFRRERWLRGIITALIAAGFGLCWYWGHYRLTTLPAHELDGTEAHISGRVLEYPRVYEEYCRVRIMAEGENIKGLEAILYDRSMTIADAKPGDILSFDGRIRTADIKYGEEYDYYNSRDIYLIINTKSEVTVEDGGFYLGALPAKINRSIAQTVERIFPEDTQGFMRSLMLGDKSDLYKDEALYLAMTRAGFMHTVAVSGMHIAFLVGLLQLLLGASRRSSIICIVMVWLFVLVTGGTHSAVRAGIMQSFLLLAPVVRRENDPITSLSAALAIILLVNPYAAASAGLQLSFGAMAGIMCFAGRFYNAFTARLPENRLGRLLRGILSVAASSLAVMVFTVPLTAVHFGSVPILSPLSNILALWTVSLCFCGGYIACGLGAFIPALGAAAAWLVSWPARYIFLVCRLISAVPFAAVYLNSVPTAAWLVLSYALFGIWALTRGRARRFIIPAMLSALLLGAALYTLRLNYRSAGGVFTALDVGQGQCLTVMAGDRTVVIDCGSTGTLKNAGETAGEYLVTRSRDRIDVLLLTHLHADHANGVLNLMESVRVDTVIMPVDPEDEDGLLGEILNAAARHGTGICYVSQDTDISIGDINMRIFAPPDEGSTNERCLSAAVSVGDYDMLVTGDSPKNAEKALTEAHDLSGIELLIAGHHGSRYSSSGELLAEVDGGTAIISVGYNTYGHPTYETLERLAAYGYNILRTDLNGTIEIWIGQRYGEE